MRTRIKVMDLTLRQWDHLQDNLRASYELPDGAVRVCVEFELDAQLNPRHVEMPVRAFVALMTQLQRIENHAEPVQTGTAALPPDALPGHLESVRNAADPVRAAERTCDHGAAVTAETPSVFDGAGPVRDYADGCQSFGPYVPLEPLPPKWSAPLSGPATPPSTYEDGDATYDGRV